jgi:glucan phosphoethanolaminetransferase (alkaline phosphatase superfamily)
VLNPPPADDTAAAPATPPSVRVAVGVMAVLALLLLSNAALLWIGFDVAVDRIVDETDDITRAEARQFVLLSLVPYLILGLVLALAAVFLARRRSWARAAGLAASALLALLTLVSVLATGGVTVASLLLLVLSVAGVTSLVARTTRAWLTGTAPAA